MPEAGQRRTLGLSQTGTREWPGVVGTVTTGDIIALEQTVPDLAVCAVILSAVMITRMFYSAVIPSLPWPLHNIILY